MIKKLREIFMKYYKKSPAFTLVELLAVIVVLAIIATIGFMVVGPVIENARNSTNERNLENFEKALQREYFIMTEMYNETPTREKVYNRAVANFTGKIPISSYDDIQIIDGTVFIKNEVVVEGSTCLKKEGSSWNCETKKFICSVTNGTGENFGDEITCGSERFYVLKTTGTNIIMLAKYNLNVGKYSDDLKITGIQASGSNYPVYGSTITVTAPTTDEYLNSYLIYLKNTIGMNNATTVGLANTTLLKCTSSSCTSSPSWVYHTAYWIDYPACGKTWCNQEAITTTGLVRYTSTNSSGYGVRPMVTMLKTDLN